MPALLRGIATGCIGKFFYRFFILLEMPALLRGIATRKDFRLI